MYKLAKEGKKNPNKIATIPPKHAPGITKGNKIPRHIPTHAAPTARMCSDTVARGMPTDEKSGSRKLNATNPPSSAVCTPEYRRGLLLFYCIVRYG